MMESIFEVEKRLALAKYYVRLRRELAQDVSALMIGLAPRQQAPIHLLSWPPYRVAFVSKSTDCFFNSIRYLLVD